MIDSRRYLIYATLTTLTPLLVASALLWLTQQATFFDYVPGSSDTVFHWHQATSFARVGMGAGYYTADEAPPAASFSPYYAWALAGPVTYGSIGRLFGWTLSSGLLVNVLFFTLAVAVYLWLVRPAPRLLVYFAVILALYPPLLIYTPVNLLELPHMALGLIMAGGFYRLMLGTASRRVIIMLGVAIVLACWLRPTYGILWLPYWAWVLNRPRWALVLTVVLSALALWFYQYTAAPYTYSFGLVLTGFRTALVEDGLLAALPYGIRLYLSHLYANIRSFSGGDMSEILIRAGVIGITLAALFRLYQRTGDPTTRREMFLYGWLLGLGIAMVMLVYNAGEWVDLRFFAAPLLLATALLAARARTTWLIALIALWLIALPGVLNFYQGWTMPSYQQAAPADVTMWAARWREAGVLYDAAAPSRWCNSITVSREVLARPALLAGVDPGVGFSFLRLWANTEPRAPLKARYLLLTDADAAAYPNPELLEAHGTIDEGINLFVNNAVACAP